MEISVNGEIHAVCESLTLAELIAMLNLPGRRFAVEINQTVIPRSTYLQHRLIANDKIEIVNAIGGG